MQHPFQPASHKLQILNRLQPPGLLLQLLQLSNKQHEREGVMSVTHMLAARRTVAGGSGDTIESVTSLAIASRMRSRSAASSL
jgi:hypothetical protein